MSWIVVQFSETDEVEVLPHKWLIEEGLVSYPPISYNKSKLERAIKMQDDPSDNWQTFMVKLMSTKIYNSFSVASAKASKACITSDISEKEEYLPPKRQQKKTYLSSSGDEDADNSDSLSGFPSHPKSPINDGTMVFTNNSNSKNSPAYSRTQTSKKNPKTGSVLSESTCFSETSPSYRKNEKESDEFQRTILTYLIKIQKLLRDNEKEIGNLKLIVENNAAMLTRTLGELYKKQNLVENHMDGITQILERIPIDDTTGFDEVNALLSANMELFKDFVHFLVRLGGTDYKESIKRILQRLLTNSLMEQYSLHGHKGKKVFRNTKIFEALIEATQKVDTKCSAKDIELKVSAYLAKSTERIKISKKNKNDMTAIEDGQSND